MKKKLLKQGEKKNRSVLKTVVVLLLAFSVYGAITAYGAYQTNLRRNYENIDNSVENTMESIARSLSMIRGTTIAISGSDSLSNWTRDNDYFNVEEKERRSRTKALETEMQRTLIYNNGWNLDLIDYVAVYEDRTLLAYTFTKPYNVHAIEEKSSAINDVIRKSEDFSLVIPPTDEDPTMYTTLKIRSDYSEDIGHKKAIYVICATDASFLKESLNTTYGYEGALMYLTNRDGMIYASNEDGVVGKNIQEEILKVSSGVRRDIFVGGKRYAITKRSINSDFYFIYMLPKSEIVRLTIQSMESLLLLSIITTIIMVVLVTMIETQYEQKILMEESEIQFLQQQMNPHFLFNILLTIQIKAKMSGDETVSKMITSLSNLLRAGIYRDKRSTIPIKEELKYVEYYLSLQKERYEDRLTYTIDIEDEELTDCEVPRLSIEPLVENAVVHGLEVSDKEGKVEVSIKAAGKDILIHVKDNGVGFDPAILKLSDTRLNPDGTLTREKVGVKNTDRRIKMMYGDKYGLNIKSEINEGTDIEIKVPKRKWMVENG